MKKFFFPFSIIIFLFNFDKQNKSIYLCTVYGSRGGLFTSIPSHPRIIYLWNIFQQFIHPGLFTSIPTHPRILYPRIIHPGFFTLVLFIPGFFNPGFFTPVYKPLNFDTQKLKKILKEKNSLPCFFTRPS